MNKLINVVVTILLVVGLGCVGYSLYKEYNEFDYRFSKTYIPIDDKELASEIAMVLVDNAKDYFITESKLTSEDYAEFMDYCYSVYNTDITRSKYAFRKFCAVYVVMLINTEHNMGVQRATELVIKEDSHALVNRINGLIGHADAKEVAKYVDLKNSYTLYKLKKFFS